MHQIKVRVTDPRLNPRRTRLEVPGWSGQAEKRVDGSQEYAWHCAPFSEAATYGVEILYPYDNDLRVGFLNGELHFDGDFGPPPEDDRQWPPFRSFGSLYYTYQLLLDLKVPPEFAVKVETHPRYYTDPTDTTPLAVPALIRHWWPMIYFMVFKSPPEGRTHIFRKDEPMAQFLMIPAECEFELTSMSDEEAAERELQSRRIYESRRTLGADSQWTSATNTVFDGTYRRILGASRKCPVSK